MKNFAGGCSGCLLYVILASVLMVAMYLVIGPNASYSQPGSWEVSPVWSILQIGGGFLAAAAAGFVCAKIATSPWAERTLAGILFVLALSGLVMAMQKPAPTEPRPAVVDTMKAMQNTQTPMWALLAGLVLGPAGILTGASLVKRSAPTVGVDR